MTYVLSQHARNARVEVGPRLGLGRSTAQTTSDLLEQESDPRFPWMAGTVPGKLSPGLRLCISSGSQSGNSASHSILGHTLGLASPSPQPLPVQGGASGREFLRGLDKAQIILQ